jgi:prepilin-type N-terminal cleavage/methylation domain-containing protein
LRRRGFTLLEIVVVVAIIAILTSIGLAGLSRRTDKTRVQNAARDLAQRIAEARGIAESVGDRSGDAARLVIDFSCPATPLPSVSVFIDPGSNAYIVPVQIAYDSVRDQMTVVCKRYDIGSEMIFSETRGLGVLRTARGGPLTISFSPTGRILRPATPDNPNDWYFEVSHNTNATERFGYRILPSGIICRSTFTDAVRCNEDA